MVDLEDISSQLIVAETECIVQSFCEDYEENRALNDVPDLHRPGGGDMRGSDETGARECTWKRKAWTCGCNFCVLVIGETGEWMNPSEWLDVGEEATATGENGSEVFCGSEPGDDSGTSASGATKKYQLAEIRTKKESVTYE